MARHASLLLARPNESRKTIRDPILRGIDVRLLGNFTCFIRPVLAVTKLKVKTELRSSFHCSPPKSSLAVYSRAKSETVRDPIGSFIRVPTSHTEHDAAQCAAIRTK
jgi:hypothetical protein